MFAKFLQGKDTVENPEIFSHESSTNSTVRSTPIDLPHLRTVDRKSAAQYMHVYRMITSLLHGIQTGSERNTRSHTATKKNRKRARMESESTIEIAEFIYDDILGSLCKSTATKLHRLIKCGEFHVGDLMDRRQLYPDVYENEEDMLRQLEIYAVEHVRNDPLVEEDFLTKGTLDTANYRDEMKTEHVPSQAAIAQQMTVTRHTDIWGNTPLKEPPEMISCSVCSQKINTLRFASHLDKCLGLGNTTRAASSNSRSSSSAANKMQL